MSLPAEDSFPPIESALAEPNGLLAVGGELTPQRLLAAYAAGIFPWYEEGQPVLWWSPDPRAVLPPAEVHVSRSLRRTMRRQAFKLTMNTAFASVIRACAEPRDAAGTWITADMQQAYCKLHELGHAHSMEVWRNETLVGGLYGVAIEKLFCGESMFSLASDASKIALVALCRLLELRGWPLLDCQLPNPHLESLGVRCISRERFKAYLPQAGAGLQRDCVALAPLPWRDSRQLAESLP